jgi:hypothetical protein
MRGRHEWKAYNLTLGRSDNKLAEIEATIKAATVVGTRTAMVIIRSQQRS